MRRHRLLLLLPAVAALAWGGVSASTAAPAPCEVSASGTAITLDVDRPTEDQSFAGSDVTFEGDFAHNNGATLTSGPPQVSSVTVQVRACSDQYEAPPGSGDLVGGSARSGEYRWPTRFAWNGIYVAQVTAEGTDGERSVRRRKFRVDAPPSVPTGVKTAVSDGVVTVTWAANPEPDVVLYEIDRTRPGTPDRKVWAVSGSLTTFEDEPGPGEYSYRVIAIRKDASGEQGIKGPASGAVTASIAEPPPSTTTPGSDTGTGTGNGTGSGTGTGTGSTSSGGTTTGPGSRAGSSTAPAGSSSRSPAVATTPGGTARTGRVDLSDFAALLSSRSGVPQGAYVPGAPDPGFNDALPFQRGQAEEGVEEPVEVVDSPRMTQQLINDDSERRRSVGFLAFGLLLFVMSMLGMWVKGEVKRVEELEALDHGSDEQEPEAAPDVAGTAVAAEPAVAVAAAPLPTRTRRRRPRPEPDIAAEAETAPAPDPVPEPLVEPLLVPEPLPDAPPEPEPESVPGPAPQPAPEPGPELAAAPPVMLPPRRVRRQLPPLDAPGLDVPEPVPSRRASNGGRTRTADARRAPRSVPSRPTGDRREGRAAVRAGGGGTRGGNRRVPVG